MLELLISPEALAFYVALLTFAAGHLNGKYAVVAGLLAWLARFIKSQPPKPLVVVAALMLAASGARAAEPSDCTCFVHRRLTAASGEAGTGTCVSCEAGRTLVVTCAHVVPDGDFPLQVIHQGKPYPARFIAAGMHISGDKYAPDLALLSVEGELPVVEIAREDPKIGDRLRQWGFGGGRFGGPPSFKEGVLLSNRRPDGWTIVGDDLHSTLPSESGDSGSGLFNDLGELAGVTWGGAPPRETLYLNAGVRVTTVRSFIKRHASRLFPRLAKRLEEKRSAKKPAGESKKPAPKTEKNDKGKKGGCCCPDCQCAQGKGCACEGGKKAEPKKPAAPQAPAGRWKYIGRDPSGRDWYEWTGPRQTPPSNCPGGNCPAPRNFTPGCAPGGCPGGVCPAPRGFFRR